MSEGWEWDPSLYEGSARYYAAGRVPYPPALVDALVAELRPDGSGRLLDIGCGPGSLTLLLARFFAWVTGLDPDAGMLAEAERCRLAAGLAPVEWVQARAEDLPAGLGQFDVVTLAQSFHWTDQPRVAALLREVLVPGGTLVHVHATTHRGVGGPDGSDAGDPTPNPRPPHDDVDALVRTYLGAERRAGQGTLGCGPDRRPAAERPEDAIYRGAGFHGPKRLRVPGRTVDRTADQVVASVFSLSYAAPHLFGERVGAFEADLRALLARVAPDGRFSELMREIDVDVWRR